MATSVTMLEAQADLGRLVEAVESGAEAEIIIARDGKPAARLVPVVAAEAGDLARAPRRRAGFGKGLMTLPDDWDELDAEMEKMWKEHGYM